MTGGALRGSYGYYCWSPKGGQAGRVVKSVNLGLTSWRVAANQIKSLCTFPDRRAAFWACTGVLFLLVFGWLWCGFFDFWLLVCFWWWLGLVWVVWLLGWLGGGCLLFMVVFPGGFFVLGVGGC